MNFIYMEETQVVGGGQLASFLSPTHTPRSGFYSLLLLLVCCRQYGALSPPLSLRSSAAARLATSGPCATTLLTCSLGHTSGSCVDQGCLHKEAEHDLGVLDLSDQHVAVLLDLARHHALLKERILAQLLTVEPLKGGEGPLARRAAGVH